MIFPATLIDLKWMKAAKAWRMFFELPSAVEAVQMTPHIETNVSVKLQHDSLPETPVLNPCHIENVIHKNRKYVLSCETCSESQKFIGTLMMAMIGMTFQITVSNPTETKADATPKVGTISEQAKKGLHTTFFQNRHFQEYISSITGKTVETPTDCKSVYKAMLQVTSCREIEQSDYKAVLDGFNSWLARRGPDGRG